MREQSCAVRDSAIFSRFFAIFAIFRDFREFFAIFSRFFARARASLAHREKYRCAKLFKSRKIQACSDQNCKHTRVQRGRGYRGQLTLRVCLFFFQVPGEAFKVPGWESKVFEVADLPLADRTEKARGEPC